ncbi:trappc1-1 [Symbiodinium microadriaticum]|nr:trappc1-1 [Symbiodinium microadriaticum]
MSLLTWSSSQDARAQNWPGINQEVRFVAMTEQADVSNVNRDRQFDIVRDGEFAEAKKVLSTADMAWRHSALNQNFLFFYSGTTPSRFRTVSEAVCGHGREPGGGGGCPWTDTPVLCRSARQHGGCEVPA